MSRQSTTANRPALTLRDGALKATIWRRQNDEGDRYTVTLARTYQDQDQQYQDTNSFSGSELLRISRLAARAYDSIDDLRR